ncbi:MULTISPECIES: TetR/AcrR family transcriptional regulator [Gordonia]|uniref:TetR/AcrR family transcriptional regulator n=1 Tax=Gordonia TaxID=2053 RepID=UPI001FE421F6|nr:MULTISPECIES: TetR/AcrR family transcriptional regulator [Gordonia]
MASNSKSELGVGSPSERGERRGRKSIQTRTRILDATAKVLSTKGYAGTHLRDVAEVAGVRATAIYYYFDSRDALVEEVLWWGLADLRRHVRDTLDAAGPCDNRIDRIMMAVDAHLRRELEVSDYTTASIRNTAQIPEHLRTRAGKEAADYGRMWHQLIEDAAHEGDIRSDMDLFVVRMLLLGSLNWAAEWHRADLVPVATVVTSAQALIRQALTAPHAAQQTVATLG